MIITKMFQQLQLYAVGDTQSDKPLILSRFVFNFMVRKLFYFETASKQFAKQQNVAEII